jgi:hypothetical protein
VVEGKGLFPILLIIGISSVLLLLLFGDARGGPSMVLASITKEDTAAGIVAKRL